MIGRRLSHYLIEERLGAGAMGEVYRARDEKLGRDVALKVLPPQALDDEEARRRFRKEAVVLSRLSHPHIATLFDFDSADGIDFLVMELVLGPTLEQELRQGPLAERDVLRLGSQLARGLVAAHEQGVVHRDLKPSNLQLTGDGMLKILDFGVARLERAASSRSGTETATETSPGDVIGSPPYMAPEQLLGRPVDARTDVYAVGACLYEMATGRRPYGEKHGAALTEAILHEAVAPPRSVNGAPSAGLESVILKCVDKEPGLRYQTAKELAVDLERLQASTTAASASQPVATAIKPMWRRPWLVGVGALLVVATAAVWLVRPLPPPRVMAVRPLTGELALGTGSTPLLGGAATDGARVYYLARVAGRTDLLQVPVGGGDPVEVPLPFGFNHRCVLRYVPGEGALLMLGTGEQINDDAPDFGVPLWLVPVPTGTARRIPNLRARWADLSRDGRTLVLVRGQSGRNHRLYLARLDGSGERPLIEVRSGVGVVRWAPDGRRLRFASPGPPGHERETWIWETSVDGEAPRPLWGGHSGGWTEEGELFVYSGSGNQLFARSESQRWWIRAQEARPLTVGPLAYTFVQSEPAGRWVLALGAMFRREPLRRDAATGRWEPALGGESAIGIEPSPDRQWLAWVRLPDASLWRSRRDGSERLRLTAPGVEASQPRWSPDGRAIAFVGRNSDDRQRTVRVVATDGSSAEVVARPGIPTADYWDPCWLPDGSIVFSHLETERPGANGLLRYDPGTRRTDRLAGAEELRYPRCSAPGDLLAVGRAGTEGFHYWTRRAGTTTWSAIGTFPLSYPNWRRDGRAFCGLNWLDRSAYSVDCVSVDSGRVERTFALGPVVPMVWHAARWSGLDGDDQPLVVAERSRTALYALDWDAP